MPNATPSKEPSMTVTPQALWVPPSVLSLPRKQNPGVEKPCILELDCLV